MTGLERNADVVRMASYAPMFAKYGNVQWADANMIWFNNTDYVLTPNYYVQKLFSTNAGDYSLPTEVELNKVDKTDILRGGISLGTWNTQAEFKDLKLRTVGKSEENAQDISFLKVYHTMGNGEWNVINENRISQTSDEQNCMYCIPGNGYWRNYTISLKAKKTGGKEGFQIGVALEDGENYYRVNIGGWNPMSAKVQKITDGVSSIVSNVAEQSYSSNVNIENDKWYDIRVEVTDYEIKGYLDDVLVCSYKKGKDYGPVYASSVYDEETGEVIVKVVNTMDSDVDVDINTTGAEVGNVAKTTVMSGDSATVNSLENKNAIVPVDGEITNVDKNFTYNAPANSLSIIRLSTKTDHKAYISGYTDGTFRPDNTITRAEAATLFAKKAGIDENREYMNTFIDIKSDAWYADFVNFAKEKGYISGYGAGVFKPEETITRAEFAVILGRYLGIEANKRKTSFYDVDKTHYASGYIEELYQDDIISGYGDRIFNPDATITRAEAVTMINKALGRIECHELSNPFTDVSPSHWAYEEIMEAAVSH